MKSAVEHVYTGTKDMSKAQNYLFFELDLKNILLNMHMDR